VKKLITIVLAICITTIPIIASSNSESLSLTHKQLGDIYNSSGYDGQMLDVQYQLNKSSYEDNLEQYKDLEKLVDNLKGQTDVYATQVEQLWDKYKSLKDTDTITIKNPIDGSNIKMKAKAYVYQQIIGMTGATSSFNQGYKESVKGQLELYITMENLKLLLENNDTKKIQQQLISKDNFDELCYEYDLIQMKQSLILQQKQLLENKIEIEQLKIGQGVTIDTEYNNLLNQLLNIKTEEVQVKSDINSKYETIKKTLNLSEDKLYNLKITIPQTTPVEIIDYTTFENFYKKYSLDYKTLNNNLEIQENYISLVKEVYKEDDYEYKVKTLNYDKNKINNNNAMMMIELGIQQKYNTYNTALKQYKVSIVSYEIASDKYKFDLMRSENGSIDKIGLEQATYDYSKAEYDYYSSMLQYIKAFNKYKQSCSGL